jgi:hypothetical protein
MKTLDPSLHLGSPNHKLFFELPIWSRWINFLPKWSYENDISNWLELVLDPNLKALGLIYGH